ncbi:hypothetical protein FBUS_03196 [Fasciolopsis buskii]|uniref:Uncharacterized protein n=1 Tax=Fasciolopsis buskii TaxID=27845 RepID=A0A8E0S1A8_9TREM|nr:hypothetical protein FBUS_03196 [Fasciolopsis buski]
MSHFVLGPVILQVLLLWGIEGLNSPSYSQPRPVTKAEIAEFYWVIYAKFWESGIHLNQRGLWFVEVSTKFHWGTYYRFKVSSEATTISKFLTISL